MPKITLDPSAYSSKFYDIIHSWDRYIIAYGGRGSGKTDSLYLKYLLALFEPYYFRLIYVNKEKSNIRDQQYAGFKRVAKRIGLDRQLKFYDGDYRIENKRNGNALIPKGMDDTEKAKGLDDATAVWWDEANKGTIEDFRSLNDLLRSPSAQYLQFALSFNPVAEIHWLRQTFFHPEDRHKVHPDYAGELLLNRSTFKDNEYIDRDAYYKTLLSSAAGNKNAIRVNIEGDWGLEENLDPWLYALDTDKHVRETLPFYPAYSIYLSFDFNRSPVTCTATQMSPHKGAVDSFIHTFKEFKGDIQLRDLCTRIKQEYPNSIFYVTGDASGNSGDVGFEERNATYYTMIQSYLSLSDKQMNINSKNLQFGDSRNLCNTMLYSYPNILVSKSGCPSLVNDMEIATIDEKSVTPHKLKKDRDVYKMDMFDNWRYLLQTYFLEFANKVYLNKK